jgi:hypothetical protein
MSRFGFTIATLSVGIAGCARTASQPEETVTDAGCVASPTAGAACEPGILACRLDEACQPDWACDTASRTWGEVIPNCFAEPPACERPTPGGACDRGVPVCPEVSEAGCGTVVTWTCNSASHQWDESVVEAGCDADAGQDAGSRSLGDASSQIGPPFRHERNAWTDKGPKAPLRGLLGRACPFALLTLRRRSRR